MIKKIMLLYIFSAMVAARLHAATYWVSPEGAATWANCQGASPLGGTNACALGTANLNALAGDTVYLRDGIYLLTKPGQGGIAPRNSGTDINNRILFVAAPNETPVIKGSGCYDCGYGLSLGNKNKFIKIDGITFLNNARWAMLTNFASHNEVTNCTFRSETGEDVVIGFFIGSWCSGGAKMDCYSTHNWIHDNTFSKAHRAQNDTATCYEGRDLFRIGDPPNPAYGVYTGANDNNTIENNYMEYGAHAILDSYGTYTVIRNNVMHNEGWVPDTSGGTCAYPPMPNGKYGHRVMQISEDFGRDGVFDLIEGNRMGYSSSNPNNPGEGVFAIAAPKNIVRHNFIYGGQQSGIYFKYPSNGKIGSGGAGSTNNRVYHNTLYHNGHSYPYMQKAQPGCSTCPGKLAGITLYSATLGNIIKNNIAYDNYSYYLDSVFNAYKGLDITVDSGKNPEDYPQIAKVVNNWTTSNGNPKFTNPDLSNPASSTLPDLRLNSDSPAIDKGAALTAAAGAGTNSVTLTVDDALYFQDGSWGSDLARALGNFQADWIAVGSAQNAAQIKKIDYNGNVMTLSSPLSWKDKDPIFLYKDSSGKQVFHGQAPDMGAHEYPSATHGAATCSQADVQAAVNSAQAGDTVLVPAGKCAWTTVGSKAHSVSVTKPITLKGAGIDQTIIVDDTNIDEEPLFISTGVRLTGFTFTGMKRLPIRGVAESAVIAGGSNWRIDHNKFHPNRPSGEEPGRGLYAWGTGVIDHNEFIDTKQGIAIYGRGDGSWNSSPALGTGDAVFIEDNIFTYSNPLDGAYDAYHGANYVFRHNTVHGTNIGHHGLDSGGFRSPHKFEIYANTFDNPGSHIFTTMNFRGGSGVVFGNTVTANGGSYDSFAILRNYRSDSSYASSWGPCDGTNDIDGNTPGGEGYPCMDQIGRAAQQSLSPVYGWNNSLKGSTSPVFSVAAYNDPARAKKHHILENRDFYNNVKKPGYTPYVYPHPLVSGEPPPSPTQPPSSASDKPTFRNNRIAVTVNDGAGKVDISTLSETSLRKSALTRKNLVLIGSEVDFTMSTGTLTSATVYLPFDASLIPAGFSSANAKVIYFNPATNEWEIQDNVSVQGDQLLCTVPHFSIYAPVIIMSATAPEIKEIYVYPNPAVGGQDPVIHVKMGLVDTLEIDIYDVSGTRVHSASVGADPRVGPHIGADGEYYYEYAWSDSKASGTYIAAVKGKTATTTVKGKIKFAVVR